MASSGIFTSLFSFQTPRGESKCLRIKAPIRQNRQSVHFTMLLDTSGSMDDENRLKNVKWSLKHILKYLTAEDKISLIEFHENAHILFKQKEVTPENKILIEHTIERIKADGGTNLSSSIVAARECLLYQPDTSATSPYMKHGVVLLTDGHANEGITEPLEINRILSRVIQDSSGASFACIGYGVHHNSELMRSMATEGGGSYNVVQNLEDVAEVFANILGGLITCSAQQVEIIISGKYTAKNLNTTFAVHFNEELNQTRIFLGDLQSENEVVLILPNEIDSVTVKGYDLCNLNAFEEIVENFSGIVTEDEKKLGLVNYFRLETAYFIDDVRQALISRTQFEELRNRLVILREQIQIANTDSEHPLYALLLEEILEMETAMNPVANNLRQTQAEELIAMETSHVFAQHSAYLSLGRGVRSHFTPNTPNLRQLSRQASGVPQLQATFSNTLQRHISQDLTSQIDESNVVGAVGAAGAAGSDTVDMSNVLPRSLPRITRNFVPPILENLDARNEDADGTYDETMLCPAYIPVSPIIHQ